MMSDMAGHIYIVTDKLHSGKYKVGWWSGSQPDLLAILNKYMEPVVVLYYPATHSDWTRVGGLLGAGDGEPGTQPWQLHPHLVDALYIILGGAADITAPSDNGYTLTYDIHGEEYLNSTAGRFPLHTHTYFKNQYCADPGYRTRYRTPGGVAALQQVGIHVTMGPGPCSYTEASSIYKYLLDCEPGLVRAVSCSHRYSLSVYSAMTGKNN